MTDKNTDLQEKEDKFVADPGDTGIGQEFVPSPSEPEGGKPKKRRGDLMKDAGNSKSDPLKEGEEEDEDASLAEAVSAILEGEDLTEGFKNKVSVLVSAAVNEQVRTKVATIQESLEAEYAVKLEEAVEAAVGSITENLDAYLDYVAEQWMEENKLAVESGIKVEMAESFMEGLKNLFVEHNVDISEEKVDVVAALEEEVAKLRESANAEVHKNMQLAEENAALKSAKIFDEIVEGLTDTEVERLRILAEKLDNSNLDSYRSDLSTIKESFFKKKATSEVKESIEDEGEILTEETAPVAKPITNNLQATLAFLDGKK